MVVVTQFAADLRQLGPANFLYADAEFLLSHGHRRIHPEGGRIEPPGLYHLVQGGSTVEQHFLAQGPPAVTDSQAAPVQQTVTLIASVPLGDAAWQPFAEGEVVVVSARSASPQRMRQVPGASTR